MDFQEFYRQLFMPLEPTLGPIDRDTTIAIAGFDAGGPLNFCTFGRERGDRFITYVSCELAIRSEQRPGETGRYELLVTCDDERWVRAIVTDIGRMSLEVAFGHRHTLDIGPWADPDEPLQAVVFETASTAVIDGAQYGILRCIGITRPELEYAHTQGTAKLLTHLKNAGVYPHTERRRQSVL